MPIYRPSELHELGVDPKKNLSQNFLIDRNIIEKILKTSDVQKGDLILEIGPGPGALTEQLLKRGAHVTAVEKDLMLAKKLERLQNGHLKIICDDALTFPLEKPPKGKWKVVANLPYHITTPILQRLIKEEKLISSITVMVQREFGKRMTAEKNTSSYSSFTLFLQAYSDPKYAFTVKPTSFYPAPSVHSCVIHLSLKPFPFSFSEEAFFLLTRTAFGKRRKMLKSSLKELYPNGQVEKALEASGFPLTARPQELSLADFGALFLALQNYLE